MYFSSVFFFKIQDSRKPTWFYFHFIYIHSVLTVCISLGSFLPTFLCILVQWFILCLINLILIPLSTEAPDDWRPTPDLSTWKQSYWLQWCEIKSHMVPKHQSYTLIHFLLIIHNYSHCNKIKGKSTHMECGNMPFETYLLYVTAEWNNEQNK